MFSEWHFPWTGKELQVIKIHSSAFRVIKFCDKKRTFEKKPCKNISWLQVKEGFYAASATSRGSTLRRLRRTLNTWSACHFPDLRASQRKKEKGCCTTRFRRRQQRQRWQAWLDAPLSARPSSSKHSDDKSECQRHLTVSSRTENHWTRLFRLYAFKCPSDFDRDIKNNSRFGCAFFPGLFSFIFVHFKQFSE